MKFPPRIRGKLVRYRVIDRLLTPEVAKTERIGPPDEFWPLLWHKLKNNGEENPTIKLGSGGDHCLHLEPEILERNRWTGLAITLTAVRTSAGAAAARLECAMPPNAARFMIYKISPPLPRPVRSWTREPRDCQQDLIAEDPVEIEADDVEADGGQRLYLRFIGSAGPILDLDIDLLP
jgi:hypothetical protein